MVDSLGDKLLKVADRLGEIDFSTDLERAKIEVSGIIDELRSIHATIVEIGDVELPIRNIKAFLTMALVHLQEQSTNNPDDWPWRVMVDDDMQTYIDMWHKVDDSSFSDEFVHGDVDSNLSAHPIDPPGIGLDDLVQYLEGTQLRSVTKSGMWMLQVEPVEQVDTTKITNFLTEAIEHIQSADPDTVNAEEWDWELGVLDGKFYVNMYTPIDEKLAEFDFEENFVTETVEIELPEVCLSGRGVDALETMVGDRTFNSVCINDSWYLVVETSK